MPRLLAYLVHWPDWPPGWNVPTPPPDAMRAGLDLPSSFPVRDGARTAFMLSEGEVAVKGSALAKYVSQEEVIPGLLAAFVRRSEPFVLLTASELRETEHMVNQSVNSGYRAERSRAPGTPNR